MEKNDAYQTIPDHLFDRLFDRFGFNVPEKPKISLVIPTFIKTQKDKNDILKITDVGWLR